MKFSGRPVPSGASQGLILTQIQFNLNKKPGQWGRGHPQAVCRWCNTGRSDRLEKWADWTSQGVGTTIGNVKSCTWRWITTSTSKHWGWPTGKQLHREGPGVEGRGPGGHQPDHKPATQSHDKEGYKHPGLLPKQRVVSRRWSFPSTQCYWGHICSIVFSSGLPIMSETWTPWLSKGPKRWLRDWSFCYVRRDWQNWDWSVRRSCWKAFLQGGIWGLGGLQVDCEPVMHHCRKVSYRILGCIRKGIASRWQAVILLLYSALVRNIWSAESSPGLLNTRKIQLMEQLHSRVK